jgi:hypothetical protein
MSMRVWVELKYGLKGHGITICKLDSPYLLQVFKRCALQRAEQFQDQSKGVDEIIHLHDELELRKIERLLEKLISNGEDKFESKNEEN